MNIADKFDPELTKNAGFLLDSPDPTKPIGEDGKRLLHLVYWLTYTRAGRQFLNDWKPSKQAVPPADRKPDSVVIAQLTTRFTQDFNLTDQNVLEACIQLHFQATYWVDANAQVIAATAAGNASSVTAATAERDLYEANYKMYLSVITWQLWEDGIGHEFSLGW